MPGMAISRIRQRVWSMRSDARNSSAEANVSAAKPNSRSRSGSDSRTDSSSSTTETSGRLTIYAFLVRSCAPLVGRVRMAPGVPSSPALAACRGMENENVAPGPSFGSAQIFPPWLSMIERLTEQADAHAVGLGGVECVEKSSRRLAARSPTPASFTVSRALPVFLAVDPDQQVPRTVVHARSSRPTRCAPG